MKKPNEVLLTTAQFGVASNQTEPALLTSVPGSDSHAIIYLLSRSLTIHSCHSNCEPSGRRTPSATVPVQRLD